MDSHFFRFVWYRLIYYSFRFFTNRLNDGFGLNACIPNDNHSSYRIYKFFGRRRLTRFPAEIPTQRNGSYNAGK